MPAYTARRANCAMGGCGAYPVYHQLSENHPVLSVLRHSTGDTYLLRSMYNETLNRPHGRQADVRHGAA
jgi:hypothetical protein